MKDLKHTLHFIFPGLEGSLTKIKKIEIEIERKSGGGKGERERYVYFFCLEISMECHK